VIDLFGNEIVEPKKGTQPKGYVSTPGSGPAGETCKTCRHIVRIELGRTYLKCELNSHNWTHGKGSDIKAGSPACAKWEVVI
jgi:hypothetical protein